MLGNHPADPRAAMRITRLLPLALFALPALALSFDALELARPDAFAGVTRVHVADATTELPQPKGRFDRSGDEPRAVRDTDAAAQAAELTDDLRRGFERKFDVVDAPGPGVLVVKPTLTRLASSRPTLADFDREIGLSFQSVYAGGAAVTVVFERDGQTVATVRDRYDGSFSDGSPRIGVWQDSQRAYSLWARQLPALLDVPATAAR